MCIYIYIPPTKTIRKRVISKFQTTLPHIHTRKNPQDTHSHTEEK